MPSPCNLLAGPGRAVRVACCLALATVLGLALCGPDAAAQLLPVPKPPPATEPAASPAPAGDEVSEESPRASVTRFLDLCGRGHYGEAARYLDLPSGMTTDGTELARQLKAVLDRHLSSELSKISSAPTGNLADGLPASVEEVARIPSPAGGQDAARLVRRSQGGETLWLWSQRTVALVPKWYEDLDERWLLEHIPAPLLRSGPWHLRYWQLLLLPACVLLAWGLGHLFGRLTHVAVQRLTARTQAQWDDLLQERLRGPARLLWTLLLLWGLLPLLKLYPPAQKLFTSILRGGSLIVLLWGVLRTLDVAGQLVSGSAWALHRPTAKALIPLGRRLLKATLTVLMLIGLLSGFGYPVASLLAGLGIGGLAVALAAQKTVENLFGALSIGTDQPFREGDFIAADNIVGTVEQIGLRSTRIRTLDRTLISIPNGKLADTRVESFAARDRIRLSQDVGLVYGSTAAQVAAVLAGIEELLRAHPKLWTGDLSVRLRELGDSALVIEVMAWFATTSWSEFTAIRQDILLGILQVVEAAGTGLAFPTRTVHLVGDGAPGTPGVRGSGRP
ncbi:MAG: mechanosensitive ion channel family protein [Polyangia bacterium]